MPKSLGFSLYLSTYPAQCDALRGWTGTGAPVFLSLHISEEFDESYCRRAEALCLDLARKGFRIIADVSAKTLGQFGCGDLVSLAKHLQLWALWIDYGFAPEEIEAMAQAMPIVLNASTTDPGHAAVIAASGQRVLAMHNFYPRPETGLDEDYLHATTKRLQQAGLEVMAFIPGDAMLRGPVFQGLPTLEAHRNALPSAAFVDLSKRFGIDHIFLADPLISEKEARRIARFCREDIISVPVRLDADWSQLYDRVFTCRIDSPNRLIRFQESRVYSCQGEIIAPGKTIPRSRGCITIDNERYGRYSGEIQLIRSALQADERVNVIGQVSDNAMLLIDNIHGGQKFTLVRP